MMARATRHLDTRRKQDIIFRPHCRAISIMAVNKSVSLIHVFELPFLWSVFLMKMITPSEQHYDAIQVCTVGLSLIFR